MPFMPKKTTNKSAGVASAIKAIRAYCESVNISINQLSKEVGVGQSSLFRFVNGERRTLTATAKKTLSYVNKQHNWHNLETNFSGAVVESEEYKIIEDAVLSYWDGSRQSAKLLAEIIKAISPFVAMASEPPGENRKGMDYDGAKSKSDI